jgi:hypothetical protein
MRKPTLLLGGEGAMVERGLLPTLCYKEKEGVQGSMSTLRIESMQLLGVPWVFDVYPCLGVAQPVRASWYCFMDEVWAFPW